MVDTSHDGLISADELETALRAYAKSKNYQVTPEDEKWVEETAGRADTNDDDHLDYNEFVQFAHEF
jgi:Ca2+-binding EF-hand superfamily protein